MLPLTAILTMAACSDEGADYELYPRNEGEEVLTVSSESLEFLGRGGTLDFSVEASYDGTITADDWMKLSASEFPGDRRNFTVSIVADANKTGADRSGTVVIRTPNIEKTITITQSAYNRPDFPESIANADDFVYFLETVAPYFEAGESIALSADIDLTGKEITSAEYFNGALDGAGHRITGYTGDKPLFAVLNPGAVVRNLTIASSCSYSIPSDATYFGPVAAQNYGTIDGCENDAAVTVSADRTDKLYFGGIAGYVYDDAEVTGCTNKGALTFAPGSSTANVNIGGITGFSTGKVRHCENYGAISAQPGAMSKYYFIGGISARQENGELTYNINHKEGKITVGKTYSGTGKSYFGGIVGYVDGHPVTTGNQNYGDLDIGVHKEVYVGGLQGWMERVSDADANMFEGSVVNCTIIAYTAGKGKNGTNPCNSAGLVAGRFYGQKGYSTLHYGTADAPIKASGTIICSKNNTKLVAMAKNFQNLLTGDGSGNSVNNGNVAENDFSNVIYEVVGDGQTGDPEELVVTTDPISLEVPVDGGSVSFIVKSNYDAKVSTDADWLSFSETETVTGTVAAGDGTDQTVTVYASANPTSSDRSAKVSVELPMGTYKEITISQKGNDHLPGTLTLDVDRLELDPAGMDASTFSVTANYEAAIAADADWLSVSPSTVPGDETAHVVTVKATKNNALGAARTAHITISLPTDKPDASGNPVSKVVEVSQAQFVFTPKAEVSTAEDFVEFLENAADAELFPSTFTVKLTSDIDMKGVAFTPASGFAGTFDGGGHSIRNLKANGPLFAVANGTIRNLVIDGSCSYEMKEASVPSASSLWLGTIVGNSETGTIEGCTSKATVTMTEVPSKQTFLGGIIGRIGAGATVVNCTNEGTVKITPEGTVAVEVRVAGVVAGANGSIKGLKNDAPVEYSPAGQTTKGIYLGGVTSYIGKDMDDCINTSKGKVTFAPKSITDLPQSYVAGLAAFVNKATTCNIRGSRNFGDIKVTADDESIAIGGIAGWIKSGGAGSVLMENCSVNCNISAVTPASGVTASSNPLKSAGMLLGRVALKSGKDNVTTSLGTADVPVKVAGSITVLGGSTTTLDSSNYTNFVVGNSLNTNYFGTSAKLTVHAEYSVTSE